ncbi:hypothetical protein TEGL_27850 [Terrisporobacter glycolicus ATCC 14880 = DSM 1288]|uniref:Uncharacterized protein n=1 Tax=Terrisporobacter glycolicus ATCC 14880 = DSM 1288 TaxID=1121315 RepID=A0ABZ2EWZ3_9FIRM
MDINFKNYLFLSIFVFSFLYCLLYILRDCYFATQNFQMKKYINKVLPFFTKYNELFLVLTFILLIVNLYGAYITKLLFYLIVMTIIVSLIFIYIPIKKLISTKYLRFLSYILFIGVLLIPLV